MGFPGKDLSGGNEGYSSNGEATYPGPAAYAISDNGLGTSSQSHCRRIRPSWTSYSSGMFRKLAKKLALK